MAKLAQRFSDKRLPKLIRAFLTGRSRGPLSPLLSNIVLDELDQEQRGLRFADDGNIYLRGRQAGGRVMESIARFIATRLKLKVNVEKSAVARPLAAEVPAFAS